MEKEVKTDVNEVTVFLNGAQIVRKKSVDLLKGKTILKFVNLSPFIDSKSIQIKAERDLTVLAVNHQQNYLNEMEKPAELVDLEEQLDDLEEKIKTETSYLSIIQEEIAFMQVNREIGGKNIIFWPGKRMCFLKIRMLVKPCWMFVMHLTPWRSP